MTDDLTDEQKAKLIEMIDTWDKADGAIRFLTILGTAIKWILGIGASVALIWSTLHGGSPK